jgi:hypothetical protein
MKPETLEAIQAEATELYPSTYEMGGIRFDSRFYEHNRKVYIKGANKYAELLESEREKSEKLVEKVAELMLFVELDGKVQNGYRTKEIVLELKALTEYKTTSK